MISPAASRNFLRFKDSIRSIETDRWLVRMVSRFSEQKTFFFAAPELWYHTLMMPVLFPLGNQYFVGNRYFSDGRVSAVGTALVFVLYWFSIITLTYKTGL